MPLSWGNNYMLLTIFINVGCCIICSTWNWSCRFSTQPWCGLRKEESLLVVVVVCEVTNTSNDINASLLPLLPHSFPNRSPSYSTESVFLSKSNDNGQEGTSTSFLDEKFGPVKQRWQGDHGWTVLRPHSSMNGRHSEPPPRRDAIYFISGLVWWRRGGHGRLGG